MPVEIAMAPETVAILVKEFRKLRGWSQEVLAELAGVSSRSVQRVERGEPADVDSLRAIARAFQLDDIDAFLKPVTVPTEEDVAEEQARIKRDYVRVPVQSIHLGRELLGLAACAEASMQHTFGTPPEEVAMAFAELIDYMRDVGDLGSEIGEVQRVEFGRDLDRYLEVIKTAGYNVAAGVRRTQLRARHLPDAKGSDWRILYVTCHPSKALLTDIHVPRTVNFG